MQATHSGRLGQWDGILYSEECKSNLMPVHWLDKVIYEDGECTIYHGKGQLRKKLASGICQIRADELIALPCRHFPMNAECPDCVGQQARRSQSMPEYRGATGFLGRVYMDRIGPTSCILQLGRIYEHSHNGRRIFTHGTLGYLTQSDCPTEPMGPVCVLSPLYHN